MADTFELEIATPNRLLVREHVTEAQIPAANGYLGILPDHSPLLAALGSGSEAGMLMAGAKAIIAELS